MNTEWLIMRKPANIAAIYDYPLTVTVFRRDETQAAVSLGDRAIILCPREWCGSEVIKPLHPNAEQMVRSWFSTTSGKEAAETFGALLAWSSRRANPRKTRYVFDAEAEGQVPQTSRPAYNPERVDGHPFDRQLIRETLQTFVECGCPADWRLTLRWFAAGEGQILSIQGYGIVAFLMSLRSDVECGTDPMPVVWVQRKASEEQEAVRE